MAPPISFEADGTNDLTVDAGTYTVTEPAVTGYATTYNTCSSLVVPGGGSATCTITNDDIAPKLTITKTVINLDGGSKADTDFSFFINGIAASLGVNTTTIGLKTVSEASYSNYAQSPWGTDCAPGGTITLAIGDIKTCTITNDDIPGVSYNYTSNYTAPIPPLIDVVKIPSPLALPAGSGLVTYNYTLKNIGTVPVTDIKMIDDSCSPVTFVSGDSNADKKLDLTETWKYQCSKTLSKTQTNIVTTTGWANGIIATDIATATVVVGAPVVPPLIHVVKKPNVFTLSNPGAVTYTYTVTNPGTVPLSNVNITDDKCTGLPGRVLGHPGDINKNNLLESNETWTFTCQTKLTKTTTNTATASGSANGLTAKDFAIATVVVSNPTPTLPKTGFPSEGENTPWNIILVAGILVLISASLLRKRKI